MKCIKRIITPLIVLFFAAWQITPAGMATSPRAPEILPEVTAALQESERVRVIVELNIPDVGSMSLSDQIEQVQVHQDAVLNGLSETEFTLKRRFQTIPALAGEITAAGLKALEADEAVASIRLDLPITAHDSAALSALQANTVHSAYGITGQGVTVAVLDTGVDIDHPDFSGRIIAQHCFTDGDCQDYAGDSSLTDESGYADDLNGHGTNVAGIIGSNGIAYAETKGFAPAAKLIALRVLDRSGSGWTSDWEAGLEWLYNTRGSTSVDVINMSLGTNVLYSGNCDSTWYTAASLISALNSAGVAIFASTGNAGSSSSISAPACISNVIGVGATSDGNLGARSWFGCSDSSTSLNKITCFTNSNAMMDMVAPGAYITSSGMGGGTSTYYGTSQASPTAAGVAALMLEVNSALTPAQIQAAMQATGVAVVDAKNGLTFKRINALKAVQSQTTVSISGNQIGVIGMPTTFTAVVNPFASSVPITYTWQVDGFAPYISTDPDVNTAAYNFSTSGNKVINLTVTNGGGTFTDSHNIYIFVSLPNKVYLPVIAEK
ncbi:MAG: S8 family serine peptidase [Chloroflexi bacterium]|nr:S8 family serine peptidase [Chloroflexota bacterium]